MVCLFPITVRKDQPDQAVVPCGRCYACRANMRNEWCIRLKAENESSKGGLFLTLTYDNDHLRFSDYVDSVTGEIIKKPFPDKRDVQLFMKRLRKKFGSNSFRYFASPEYGEDSLRPHWHMLLFFQIDMTIDKDLYDFITNCWNCGFICFGQIEDASINYVTKYVLKSSKLPFGIDDLKILSSRRPAIGYNVIMDLAEQNNLKNKDFSSLSIHGQKSRFPRLYREKFRAVMDPEDYEEMTFKNRMQQQQRLLEEFKKSSFTDINAFMNYKRAIFQRHEQIVKSHQSKHNKV